ncbi:MULTISPECIES: DotU family type IV/VI secretion system protein [Halorhodospira]|uniref:DotU family type IV/VI secretion system protein n=1 Tax=Halorhodospira TaxID=85108 RepID=UPI001EE78690|nr:MULTISPECIES: DotU family type IV/VI secretion system protein [Halorhodospira]MCG5528275.1 DotU family type IV/VI secretion system protein [Halorhodospira halophila]MCG5543932.1 DotU family type IV/VI secretion system protein [Halorhodospira sp. 9628]
MSAAPEEARRGDPSPLVNIAEPLLLEAVALRQGWGGVAGDAGMLRERARQTLRRLRERGQADGLGGAALADAELAVTAFVDEAVIASAHPERAAWLAQPLQAERLGERSAGTQFFERLQGPREQAPPDAVLELYLACLWLGFQGVHALEEQALLDEYRRRLGKWLGEGRAAGALRSPVPPDPDGEGHRVGWFWSVVAALALLLLAYLHAGMQIERAVGTAMEEIEAAREVVPEAAP